MSTQVTVPSKSQVLEGVVFSCGFPKQRDFFSIDVLLSALVVRIVAGERTRWRVRPPAQTHSSSAGTIGFIQYSTVQYSTVVSCHQQRLTVPLQVL